MIELEVVTKEVEVPTSYVLTYNNGRRRDSTDRLYEVEASSYHPLVLVAMNPDPTVYWGCRVRPNVEGSAPLAETFLFHARALGPTSRLTRADWKHSYGEESDGTSQFMQTPVGGVCIHKTDIVLTLSGKVLCFDKPKSYPGTYKDIEWEYA